MTQRGDLWEGRHRFHPVGISLVRDIENSRDLLYVINTGNDNNSIEVFEMESSIPGRLIWRKTLQDKLLSKPNDYSRSRTDKSMSQTHAIRITVLSIFSSILRPVRSRVSKSSPGRDRTPLSPGVTPYGTLTSGPTPSSRPDKMDACSIGPKSSAGLSPISSCSIRRLRPSHR